MIVQNRLDRWWSGDTGLWRLIHLKILLKTLVPIMKPAISDTFPHHGASLNIGAARSYRSVRNTRERYLDSGAWKWLGQDSSNGME